MKTWLIIGSVAARHWFPDFREPKDLDVITAASVSSNDPKTFQVETHWHDAAQPILEYSSNTIFADPSILLTLKLSHSHWDVHWDKTVFDINFFMERNVQPNMGLYEKLLPIWEKIHGKKKLNMNKSNEEFFNDAVSRPIPHDVIHDAVSFYDKPLFTYLKSNPDIAIIDRKLFEKLSHDDQCKVALEEIMATAIERFNLTALSTRLDRMIAMHKAHKKICISMSKGWFSRFLITNTKVLLIDKKSVWMFKLESGLLRLEKYKNA